MTVDLSCPFALERGPQTETETEQKQYDKRQVLSTGCGRPERSEEANRTNSEENATQLCQQKRNKISQQCEEEEEEEMIMMFC